MSVGKDMYFIGKSKIMESLRGGFEGGEGGVGSADSGKSIAVPEKGHRTISTNLGQS